MTDIHKLNIQARRNREKEQRRNEILKAANNLFTTKSFVKTTMDDIALSVGLSRPTIYQYFKTKDELYMSLIMPVINNVNDRLEIIYARIENKEYETGSKLISDLVESFSEAFRDDPELFVTFMVSLEAGIVRVLDENIRQKIIENGQKGYILGRKILSSGIRQKLLRKVNVYSFGDMVWGMFWGISQISFLKSKDDNKSDTLTPTLELAKSVLSDSLVIKKEN